MIIKKLFRWVYLVYISINMLFCSILFGMWSLPRETISGFCGRMVTKYEHPLLKIVCRIIDAIYFWEDSHCFETHLQERASRAQLYKSPEDIG
jgi:hypothetical protein